MTPSNLVRSTEVWQDILQSYNEIKKEIANSNLYKQCYYFISERDYPLNEYADEREVYKANIGRIKSVEYDFDKLIEHGDDIIDSDYLVIRSTLKILNMMDNAIEDKDLKEFESLLNDLIDLADEIEADIGIQVEEIQTLLDSFEGKDTNLIYCVTKDIIRIDSIYSSMRLLIEKINNNKKMLYSISPRDFEELVYEIFLYKGFKAELTKQTRDGGYDILAFANYHDIPLKFLIECKRYAENNKVDLSLVQRLYGVKIANSANKAILVTSSTFTPDAQAFAGMHTWDLSLKDKDDVFSWIGNYCVATK